MVAQSVPARGKKKMVVVSKSKKVSKKSGLKVVSKKPDTMKIARDRDIAMDFGLKVYREFDQMIKSVVLFGSSAKRMSNRKSDIDILILIDDVGVRWDMELIAWYREELGKLIAVNPYIKPLHINTMKLSTWWEDLIRGDPIILNILRYGEPLVDFGGFFTPLKVLMKNGKIRATPEAIYTLLARSPRHLAKARQSLLAAVDGLYWAMLDSAHAALIAKDIEPTSPETIGDSLYENFVSEKMLNKKFVSSYEEIHKVQKAIIHGKVERVTGKEIDRWTEMSEEFVKEMSNLSEEIFKARSVE